MCDALRQEDERTIICFLYFLSVFCVHCCVGLTHLEQLLAASSATSDERMDKVIYSHHFFSHADMLGFNGLKLNTQCEEEKQEYGFDCLDRGQMGSTLIINKDIK